LGDHGGGRRWHGGDDMLTIKVPPIYTREEAISLMAQVETAFEEGHDVVLDTQRHLIIISIWSGIIWALKQKWTGKHHLAFQGMSPHIVKTLKDTLE
jgi:hypothetical protein